MARWAPDADYIDEAGKITRGKEALTELFKKGLAEHKGSKISGKMHSLKFLRPDVAMEDGSLDLRRRTARRNRTDMPSSGSSRATVCSSAAPATCPSR